MAQAAPTLSAAVCVSPAKPFGLAIELTHYKVISGHPLATVHEGELASAHLGMRVEVWDEAGHNIDHTGEQGELVITAPFFSMPVTFYGDDGNDKYRKAYFAKFPGVWCHGDHVHKNPVTGGFVIHGRSDGVLNPGGKI